MAQPPKSEDTSSNTIPEESLPSNPAEPAEAEPGPDPDDHAATSPDAAAEDVDDHVGSSPAPIEDAVHPDAPAEDGLPTSFEDMGLPAPMRDALEALGWGNPTKVQRAAYGPVSDGRDVVVQSQTGSGKTGAFCLPWLAARFQSGDAKETGVQLLVMTPTRELAKQVCDQLVKLAGETPVVPLPVYGGTAIGPQFDALKTGVHAVVGTPGRILDHIRRRTLDLSRVQTVVLDEADEMLSMGFLEDIHAILDSCPRERQTTLFSATVPSDIERIARRYMKDPESLKLSGDDIAAAQIDHAYYSVPGTMRTRDLLNVVALEEPGSTLIFCNTREETNLVANVLRREGFSAEALSSDLSQAAREHVLGAMRKGRLRFLVATDVASRGIDISHISHVFNYSFPQNAESYVHRTGRTGRAGRAGKAISLIGPHDMGNFYHLKLAYPSIEFSEASLPEQSELEARRRETKLDQISKRFPELVSPEWTLLGRTLSADPRGEQVIAYLLSEAMSSPDPATLVARDLPEEEDDEGGRARRGRRDRDEAPRDRDRDRDEARRGRGDRDRDGDRRGRRGRRDHEGRDRGRPRGREDEPAAAEADEQQPPRRRRRRGGEDEEVRDASVVAARTEEPTSDDVPRREDAEATEAKGLRRTRSRARAHEGDSPPSGDTASPPTDDSRASSETGTEAEAEENGRGRRRRRRRRRGGSSDGSPTRSRSEDDADESEDDTESRGPSDPAPPPQLAAAAADGLEGEDVIQAPDQDQPGDPASSGDASVEGEDADAADAAAKSDASHDDELFAAPCEGAQGLSDTDDGSSARGRRRRRRRRRRGGRGRTSDAPKEAKGEGEGSQAPAAAHAGPDDSANGRDGAQDGDGGKRRRKRRRGGGRAKKAEAVEQHVPQDQIIIDIDENELEVVRGEFGEIDELDDLTLKGRRRGVIDALQDEVELEDMSDDDDGPGEDAEASPRRGANESDEVESDGSDDDDDDSEDSDDAETDDSDDSSDHSASGDQEDLDAKDAKKRKRRRRRRKKKKADEPPPDLTAPPHKDFWEVWSAKFTYQEFEDDQFRGGTEAIEDEPEPEPEPEAAPNRRRRARAGAAPSTSQEKDPARIGNDDGPMVTVALNVGRSHGKKSAHIRELLASDFGLEGRSVRNLTVKETITEFRVSTEAHEGLQAAVLGYVFDDIELELSLIAAADEEDTAAASGDTPPSPEATVLSATDPDGEPPQAGV